MQVNLIDWTGKGHADPMYAARLLIYTKNTRLTQGEETRMKVANMTGVEMEEELRYISNTIRSSWEMVHVCFEILDVTRAFTHQLVRTRHASYAQQAQRVVDMSEFETLMPITVISAGMEQTWIDCMKTISGTYKLLRDAGVPAQDCRGVLPTNVLTNIIMKIDLRNFAELIGKRENLRAQGEYAEVAAKMKKLVLDLWPWTSPFIEPDRLATPAIDGLLRRLLGDKSPVDDPEINNALKELDRLKGTWG